MEIITSKFKRISVKEAIADRLYPNAYSYEGELEKLKVHIELQSEMIANLVELITNKLKISAEDMESLLGYGYTAEE